MTAKFRVSRSVTGSLALAAGFAVALFTAPAEAQNVRIGALEPLTGGLAQYGEASVNGITLAIGQINAQGGVLGRTLELLIGDTQTNPQAAVSAMQNLARLQGVVGVIGALGSSQTIAAATSVAAVDGIPMISPASTAPTITTVADNDFLFRTTPHDAAQGAVLGQVAREEGFGRLAVLYVNNDYGIGLAEAFSAAFTAAGGTVTGIVPFEEGQTSYRGELQLAAQDDPEALVHIAYPGDGIPQIRQALEEGFFTRFVFSDGMKTPEMIENIGAEFLNGSVGTAAESVETGAAAAFRTAYSGEYGNMEILPYVDTAYDAAFLLALAIQKAGSTDGEAVRDALRDVGGRGGVAILPGEWAKAVSAIAAGQDIDYFGAAGSQDFDSAGDVPGTIGVWVIEGGQISTREIRG